MRQQVERRHRQIGEGVEQWPEECAAPAADIQQSFGRQPAQRAQRLAYARQAHRALEAMQPQSSVLSRRDYRVELRLTQLLQRRIEQIGGYAHAQPSAHIRGGEFGEIWRFLWHRDSLIWLVDSRALQAKGKNSHAFRREITRPPLR